MGIAIIYCIGFVGFFYAGMRFYVTERYDGFTQDSLAEATALAALIATIWPFALVIMAIMFVAKYLP
jgi:hypothetical protein